MRISNTKTNNYFELWNYEYSFHLLGIPSRSNPRKKESAWMSMLEKMRKKISLWKFKQLFGG